LSDKNTQLAPPPLENETQPNLILDNNIIFRQHKELLSTMVPQQVTHLLLQLMQLPSRLRHQRHKKND